ncbi:MAG TPA: twin-arginine translocase TatA/TatE family subunit [Chloroflexota bacterium]|nr:twin-arginine translocase TatA/TatE family subunit [Chloroflexota bacterium]
MPFATHWWELLIILAIALLIFGPGRLGDVGGALGKSIREFRKSTHEDDDNSANQSSPTGKSPQS